MPCARRLPQEDDRVHPRGGRLRGPPELVPAAVAGGGGLVLQPVLGATKNEPAPSSSAYTPLIITSCSSWPSLGRFEKSPPPATQIRRRRLTARKLTGCSRLLAARPVLQGPRKGTMGYKGIVTDYLPRNTTVIPSVQARCSLHGGGAAPHNMRSAMAGPAPPPASPGCLSDSVVVWSVVTF